MAAAKYILLLFWSDTGLLKQCSILYTEDWGGMSAPAYGNIYSVSEAMRAAIMRAAQAGRFTWDLNNNRVLLDGSAWTPPATPTTTTYPTLLSAIAALGESAGCKTVLTRLAEVLLLTAEVEL